MSLLAAAFLAVVCAAPASAGTPGLVWSDEFDGPAGAPPDTRYWTAEVGGHGWGNDELEFYTARRENSRLDGKGHLVIEARREKYENRDFTSARLVTKDKVAHAYGRFEARINLPQGQGIWPAFWIMGDNIEKAGWPACGEVDVMEFLGHEPGTVYGTLHGPIRTSTTTGEDSVSDYGNEEGGVGVAFRLPEGKRFPGSFRVFAIEWEPAEIRWLVDGQVYSKHTPKDLGRGTWVFDRPFFILLNVAVGGSWPGAPDRTTVFPQRMIVDWVRVSSMPPR